jgi:allantoinase
MTLDGDVILGGTAADSSPALVIASERVLIEGELQPAVLSVQDGRIHQVWWGSADPARAGVVGETVLLGDNVVLPGAVDTHVHADEPGRTTWEGFASATRAAVLGGATTVADMPCAVSATTGVAALETRRAAAEVARARGELHCDVGFWGGVVPGDAEGLEPLWDAGVLGFTCSLAGSGAPGPARLGPEELLEAMGRIGWFGGLLAAHAEDLAALTELLDAVRETGTRTHVLHLSSARGLDLIAEAKDEGLPVTAETCRHHLVPAAEHVPDGGPAVACCPSAGDRGNQDALWDGLRAGILDCVVGDGSATTAGTGFAALAGAARRRDVPLADLSRWTAASTAALVGLDRGPRPKGLIAEGAAADLIVYDPEATTTSVAPTSPIGEAGAMGGASRGTLLRRPV